MTRVPIPQVIDNILGTEKALTKMPCSRCLHRNDKLRGDGYCYMFRTKPEGQFCGQFKRGVGRRGDASNNL